MGSTSLSGPLYVGGLDVFGNMFAPNLGFPLPLGTVYYVSANDGSDSLYDGLSPDEPKATIQAAITLSNATIDWSATPKKYNFIIVEPGVYAENLTPPYYCAIIGAGVRGTDTAAEIHPTTGSAITGTFLGTVLYNLRLEGDVASTPILNLGVCNNSLIQSCEFSAGANVAGIAAIDTDNCTHLVVRDCDFTSGQLTNLGYAGYHRGGANKFAHNVRWLNNRIWAATAGIWIQNTCTATQALAMGNMIVMDASGKGIDDNNGGMRCVGNFIMTGASGDAIEHAGGAAFTTFNQVNVNGTAAQETA